MAPIFIIHDAISYEICGKDARHTNNATGHCIGYKLVGKNIYGLLWASCSAVELVEDNLKNTVAP